MSLIGTTAADATGFTVNIDDNEQDGPLRTRIDYIGVAYVSSSNTDTDTDTDNDGMDDNWENNNGLIVGTDDSALDPDGDTLTNLQEYTLGSNPQDSDTDNDGLEDGVETDTGTYVSPTDTGTDPLVADTDNDGFPDGDEVTYGSDPTDPDSYPEPPVYGPRVLGIDFNRNDALGSPSQSLFRIVSGSTTQGDNSASYVKTIGASVVTISQPGSVALEFRGANTDSYRAIPGGDTSISFLVADFIATREGALEISIFNLPAGDYVFRSYHLDTVTGADLGFAQGAASTTPNTIEARIGGILKGSIQPTALGSAGLNTTFIDNSQVPTLVFSFTHDGSSPLVIALSSTETNGADSFLFLNGFELLEPAP
ncbi:MAG: hypothetical protein KAU94_04600 [Verrucomicrobia bacterium]|nr:hypothetical protein [Verrucomicrobiota bacterium]